MIIFHSVEFRNFLSSGDNAIKIDLNPGASTLIVGTNGAGKSTILDALAFSLFGKPHRSITKPQLVNSINGKHCVVTCELTVGNVHYKIVRGIKPNIFEIWQNGILLNQESHSRDYQKLLETNILKLNHKSFHQVVVIGSRSFTPFMQLSTNHRREVIEDLLDIGVFTKMNSALKERNAKLKDSIKDTENQLVTIKDKIILHSKHIESLKQMDSDNIAKFNEEIATLSVNVEELQSANVEIDNRYTANSKKSEEAFKKAQNVCTSLNSFEKQIKDNISKIVAEAKFYENHDECPKCNQSIESHVKDGKLGECRDKAIELQNGYDLLKSKLEKANEDFRDAQAVCKSLDDLNSTFKANLAVIKKFTERISNLNAHVQKSVNQSDTTEAIEDLEKLRQNKETLGDLKSSQVEERTYNEAIGELLKDTGIKTKVIKQYLPVMNKLINNYLQVLDFFVCFELDESFNEKIRSRHRDEFSYFSFSEGERSRIDLSLLFAWRQIAKMKNSANTNLLILDETFDAALDSDGLDNLLKILDTLDSSTNVFVISHKQDLLEGKLERKLEFEKHKNFSRVVESSQVVDFE